MENENKIREPEEAPVAPDADAPEGQQDKRVGGLPIRHVGRYIGYVIFLVTVGLLYIWNSHVAEGQVREEARLRSEIADAKAEYKTMHARLSAGTRKYVIADAVDTLGLKAESKNTYTLTHD